MRLSALADKFVKGCAMPNYWIAAVACVVAMHVGPHGASAQGTTPDVTPKLLPDRIDDVPDSPNVPGIPFPQFDNFSWRAFVALNWPALDGVANRGQPDKSKTLGDPGPRVWESYKARYEVFAPGAPKPAVWNSYDGSSPCGATVSNQTKTLSAFTHFADYNQAAGALNKLANPLIDQSRMYTRYEVRFNREQFNSIVDNNNKWYIKKNLPTKDKPGTFQDGSIELKAAWRVLKAGDTIARDRFYMNKAMVFDPAASQQAGSIICNEHDIALVGLHIVIKTKLRPQWIWSSFEHVDNVKPKTDEPDAKDVPAPYSFNSGQAPAGLFPVSPPRTISESNAPSPNPDPMQVARLLPINSQTMKMNRDYWALSGIKGTVWANYMLVMTQWPTTAAPPKPANDGEPFPVNAPTVLANTTMETYHQGAGSSCMECHQSVSNKFGRDFVAFMAFDASDPAQQLIAMATTRLNIPAFEGLRPEAKAARANADRFAKRLESSPMKSALDDDPAVKELVRMLQRR